jgi:hypothetical protein
VSLALLSPLGLLLALGAVLPLVALAVGDRRARRVRRALGLAEPSRRGRVGATVALAAVPCLLAVALAQPILRFSKTHQVRTDAEAFYIFDVSRSMLASSGPAGRTRFERAVSVAKTAQTQLADVRSGVATLTDRVLPNLFPTADEEVFTATVEEAIEVNSPPPRGYEPVGTLYAAFDTLAGTNFFSEGIPHRLAIVLTDGETSPYDTADLRAELAEGPRTDFVVIRFWHENERVWRGEEPERGYRPDPSSAQNARRLASATTGQTFDESQVPEAIAAARRLLGTGPLEDQGTAVRVTPLTRWFLLAAFVPLGWLLWRRNVL